MTKQVLGQIKDTAAEAARHPLHTGLKVVGQAVGLVRGTARAVTGRGGVPESEWVPDERPAPERAPDPAPEPTPEPPRVISGEPTPADIADNVAPVTPDQERRIEEDEVTTPAGTPAADVGRNPDTAETDLEQPGTEPLVDPGTARSVASEARTMSDAADPDKG